ncbi:conserved hypothetical protein [Methanospirillum hungatei JF-1]|uniref:Uncharacterized protein n=1 Tax=Methanospirillum hungatei JF-1 (strain ATCC 27890 / DSM 864 / NBRC 100397 / JF-1) TaxID=323259 RepID=Q2FTD5_METHJ|nr:hypothetical protein [Methanospirillum hungatei]ABD42404.1 conserved hypothetical protein [Methanospirillum hungatei JF-1]
MSVATPKISQILEVIHSLSTDEQEYIEEILHKRLIEQKREKLAREAHEALNEYYSGSCKEGSIKDLWKDLDDSNSLE